MLNIRLERNFEFTAEIIRWRRHCTVGLLRTTLQYLWMSFDILLFIFPSENWICLGNNDYQKCQFNFFNALFIMNTWIISIFSPWLSLTHVDPFTQAGQAHPAPQVPVSWHSLHVSLCTCFNVFLVSCLPQLTRSHCTWNKIRHWWK